MRSETDTSRAWRGEAAWSSPGRGSFRIGQWTVLPERDLLVRRQAQGCEERRVTPLEMRLLLRLVEEPGEVVAKAALMRDVWNDAAVVDHVLPKTMSKLRTSLEDCARSPRFIETVGRRGYRLVAVPRPPESPSPRDRPPAAPRAVESIGRRVSRHRLLSVAAVLVAFAAGLWTRDLREPGRVEVKTAVSGVAEPALPLRVREKVKVRVQLDAVAEEVGEDVAEESEQLSPRYLWSFDVDTGDVDLGLDGEGPRGSEESVQRLDPGHGGGSSPRSSARTSAGGREPIRSSAS